MEPIGEELVSQAASLDPVARYVFKSPETDASPFPLASLIICICWILPIIAYIFADKFTRQRSRTVKSGEESTPVDDNTWQRRGRANGHDELGDRFTVMCASLEHSLPHLPKAKAVAGGLGKVMDLVVRHHPTDIYMVHAMIQQVDYGSNCVEDTPLRILVDGTHETVRVWRQSSWPQGPEGHRVEFLMLSHPSFEERTKDSIYPNPMSRRAVLCFFSLWNQAVGALMAQHKPDIFHCPDFHTAVAPWYAIPALPRLRLLLVLHNAEYQGTISTDMIRGERLESLARIWNLPTKLCQRHLISDGRFNMLKSAVNFLIERQGGRGCCAVSKYYAQECKVMYKLLWHLPVIRGLDNPMLEAERAPLTKSLQETKAEAKRKMQEELGLNVDPEARLFVSLGRLVRQKGVDLIADVAPWLLETFPQAQFLLIGPIGDAFGHYAASKLSTLMADFPGRVFVKCEFMRVSDELKFAADFCLMPSRDEPFGYVDIEFAWRGAVLIGAQAGGLGKVPGFYYVAQNKENSERMRCELKAACTSAMQASSEQLQTMAQASLECDFPLDEWQQRLRQLYGELLPGANTTRAETGGEMEMTDLPSTHSGLDENGNTTTFMPFEHVSFQNVPMPKPTATTGHAVTRQSMDMINTTMSPQTSFTRVHVPQVGRPEFLTQELSEEEIAEKVQSKLAAGCRKSIEEIIEEIGGEMDQESATSAWQKWLLEPWLGVKRIHICVSLGYIFSPAASDLLTVIAGEWGLRGATNIPHWISDTAWYRKAVGTGGINPVLLNMILFIASGLASAFGAPLWAIFAKIQEPRRLLAVVLLLQISLAGMILPGHPTVSLAIAVSFLQGLLNCARLLFIVLNFMMSVTGDMSRGALRMGLLEMGRFSVEWLFMAYIFAVSPSSAKGTEEQPVTWDLTLRLLPVALLVVAVCGGCGILVLLAPGPYREDRLPSWDFALLGKRKSFLLLSLSECAGALASYPGTCYVAWWLANGWELGQLSGLSILVAVVLAKGSWTWSFYLRRALMGGYEVLIGAALLLGPPYLIRALVQAEVSTFTYFGKSHVALVISVVTLLLEGIRSSAAWTLKIRVLNSRWRLLSFGMVFVSIAGLCKAASPIICEFMARQQGLSFISTNQKEIADAVIVCTVPLGILQFVVQALTLAFIHEDMGMKVQSERGLSKAWYMEVLRRSPVATSMVTGSVLALVVFLVQMTLVSGPLPFNPVRRCSNEVLPTCPILGDVTDASPAVVGGSAFGHNRFGQDTTGKVNCFQMMHALDGDTYVFWPDVGRCQVLRCGSNSPSQPGGIRQVSDGSVVHGQPEVWSNFCQMRSQHLVAVHLMEWRWQDIARECETYLGPAGFDMVQVSPPQEHAIGRQWYVRYRPVSFALETRSGTRRDFIDMVARCRRANVSIMVDLVMNHMAGPYPDQANRTCGAKKDTERTSTIPCQGFNGTTYRTRSFEDLTESDFHHHIGNKQSNCGTPPWTNNRFLCDLFGLPDLDTESPRVQRMLISFLMDLYEIGVTMLRVDAAVHVYPSSMARILQPFPWDYLVQEVYPFALIEQKTKENLLRIGPLTDFTYGHRVAARLLDSYDKNNHQWKDRADSFKNLLKLSESDKDCHDANCETPYPEESALLFLDNHDGQRHSCFGRAEDGAAHGEDANKFCYSECRWDGTDIGECRPTYKAGQQYLVAMLYMLGYPYGDSVRLMSSYAFDFWSNGPPVEVLDKGTAMPLPVWGPDDLDRPLRCQATPESSPVTRSFEEDKTARWICEHRWRGVAGLVRFRKLIKGKHKVSTIDTPLALDPGRIAFNLGKVGFVALVRPHSEREKRLQSPEEAAAAAERQDWDLKGIWTSLKGGRYCDLGSQSKPVALEVAQCEGQTVVVGDDGVILSGVVQAGSAVALIVDYQEPPQVDVVVV